MHIDEFKLIVSTFSDPGEEMLFERNRLMFSFNGNVIDVEIELSFGDVNVLVDGAKVSASQWIVNHLAQLKLLATRLKEKVTETEYFVSPAARMLRSLNDCPDEREINSRDAKASLLEVLDNRSPLETTVLYVTSDAGEGKTSLINSASLEQAKRFVEGKSDWILVPISLGGRHFLRFDDITVGALQNRYRFSFLYYDSFLALVRMGVIVPAFDGFEEMFVENSSGEALSAMGILVGALRSAGALVVAARKAYFEFENLQSQEKLYDTISENSVGFSRIELVRWEKEHFLRYCVNRDFHNGEEIYSSVSERLGVDHSLLTRPVLVRRLIDVAVDSSSFDEFIDRIEASGPDFFSVFIGGIIEREAREKWIDRSGELASSLLTVSEHCELLSAIAVNMWESGVDFIKRDLLDVVAELFCEQKHRSAHQSRQIVERIRGHALLIAVTDMRNVIGFDHEEFRHYFLGEGLAQVVCDKKALKGELLNILRKNVLPENAQLAFSRAVCRSDLSERSEVISRLLEISRLDGQASYTQENCGCLIMMLLSNFDANELIVESLSFRPDSLRDRKIKSVIFKDCYFASSSLEAARIESCQFEKCSFGQVRLYANSCLSGAEFLNCTIESVKDVESQIEYWDPDIVRGILNARGCTFNDYNHDSAAVGAAPHAVDEELIDLEKFLRYFMRSTHISESVIKMKLGDRSNIFITGTLEKLLGLGVVTEIENQGKGSQRRFKLAKPISELNACISESHGSFAAFLARFSSAETHSK